MSTEVRSYKNLIIWQKAIDLVDEIYEVISRIQTVFIYRYGITDH
jgi:hypothetical protein